MKQNTPQRILTFLGNQSAPLSFSGTGRRVLFRCPVCQFPWLMDGRDQKLRLTHEELTSLAQELSADPGNLPACTCRLCALAFGKGVLEIDEYDGGNSYGFNWEAATPPGAHLFATVSSEIWLSRQKPPLHADVVTNHARVRAVLIWLQTVRPTQWLYLLGKRESDEIASSNPPGHGMTGTEGWQWKGALTHLFCPALGDRAIVSFAIALPPTEPLNLAELVTTWQQLARKATHGKIPGE